MVQGNKAKAAKLLGIHRTNLYQRLARLKLGGQAL
ncbi:MAG: helix-turn-helix domain-containing protein [Candidatus Methylomirabilales bacterium]